MRRLVNVPVTKKTTFIGGILASQIITESNNEMSDASEEWINLSGLETISNFDSRNNTPTCKDELFTFATNKKTSLHVGEISSRCSDAAEGKDAGVLPFTLSQVSTRSQTISPLILSCGHKCNKPNYCHICLQAYCPSCCTPSTACKHTACKACRIICPDCGKTACVQCMRRCADCMEKLCLKNCGAKCLRCQEPVCGKCIINRQDHSRSDILLCRACITSITSKKCLGPQNPSCIFRTEDGWQILYQSDGRPSLIVSSFGLSFSLSGCYIGKLIY